MRIAFVRGIGIEVRAADLPAKTFLLGRDIRDGAMLIDNARLLYPGDILHGAGHIAVADPGERKLPARSPSPADEMTTLAWSYAAARHLTIAASIVFHANGYRGGGASLEENFDAGRYVGVPLLQF